MATEAGHVPDLTELADRAAISEILALHCRGVDRADEAALQQCYWPDATAAYGETAVPAHPFCSQLASAIKAYAQTHHMITNSLFAIDGDHAKVETALLAFHYTVNADGEDHEMTYLGRYLDDFEKRDAIWKIKHREPIMSWSQNGPASHDANHPALSALRQAGRYPDDPVYQGERAR